MAPVATGVVKFEGSSDENMVALEGEMRYLAFKVASKASLNPVTDELFEMECTKSLTYLLPYYRCLK